MNIPTKRPKGRHQRKDLINPVKPNHHEAMELLREDIAHKLRKLKKFSQFSVDAIKVSEL